MISSSLPKLEYTLVENTTSRLRFAAREYTNDGSYAHVSVYQWAKLLTQNDEYIHSFTSLLKNAPMKAYFFETKGVNYSTSQEESFEFVLIESSYLYQFAGVEQDPVTFSEHFEHCIDNEFGCVFENLGGDSILIAPKPLTTENAYGHLAAFVRRAPTDQLLQVWKLALQAYLERLESVRPSAPVWLSTDGTGVRWLHIRLDPRPKYYDYRPFADTAV
jgi:hypothetical protein